MESRKMVLMNLFVGQQWKRIHREQTLDTWGKERVGQMERVAWKNVHYICKMDSQWEFAV